MLTCLTLEDSRRHFKFRLAAFHLMLVAYCCGIRSGRRLCEEVYLNLAYRWFCRLGLDGEVADNSTLSRNRLVRSAAQPCSRLWSSAAWQRGWCRRQPDCRRCQRAAHVAESDDVDWEVIARTRRSVREYLDTPDQAACGGASETCRS
ncbi:transposase [Bradyrhizobium liaoningense]|nr:transposase [Bradyrhizobium liaoningense]